MNKSDKERIIETIHVLKNGQLQETLEQVGNEDFVDVTEGIDWDGLDN